MLRDFGRPVREILKQEGWSFARQGKGSHEIWQSPEGTVNMSVPVRMKSRHTANAILKQAGSSKELWLDNS
jgi:predicted RNA binding protein YcfA (HicA-like mRNA interferase family)